MGADYKKKQSSVIGGHSSNNLGANITRYIHPFGPYFQGLELDARMVVPFDCLITDFYARATAAAGAGETFTYTIYLNGAPTALTLIIAGAADVQAGPDLGVIAIADGDELCIRVDTSLNAFATFHSWSFEVNT